MNVVLVNHSDSKGGASVVTMRLMKVLRRYGVDARMLVMHKSSDNMCVDELKPQWRCKLEFLSECADIYSHNGHDRNDLFKVSTGRYGMPLHKHPWIKDADYVILSWVNQGMLSLSEISRIEAPVFWLMHDMWCMTGICHHAGECERYKAECGQCKYLHKAASEHDLSRKIWQLKQKLYAKKPMQFVAVSTWLMQRCEESKLLRRQRLHVIPNPFPLDEFYATPRLSAQRMGLPKDKRLIAMGAARVDDPIKGLPLAIEALNKLEHRKDIAAVFFGELRNPQALDNLKIPYVSLGAQKMDDVKEIYAHSDVVLSSSLYETLPGTLVEGMAAGCVPVSFNRGGQSDIVDHLDTGYIAKYPDTDDLAAGIAWALDNKSDPQSLRAAVNSRFSDAAIAQRWLTLLAAP